VRPCVPPARGPRSAARRAPTRVAYVALTFFCQLPNIFVTLTPDFSILDFERLVLGCLDADFRDEMLIEMKRLVGKKTLEEKDTQVNEKHVLNEIEKRGTRSTDKTSYSCRNHYFQNLA